MALAEELQRNLAKTEQSCAVGAPVFAMQLRAYVYKVEAQKALKQSNPVGNTVADDDAHGFAMHNVPHVPVQQGAP